MWVSVFSKLNDNLIAVFDSPCWKELSLLDLVQVSSFCVEVLHTFEKVRHNILVIIIV